MNLILSIPSQGVIAPGQKNDGHRSQLAGHDESVMRRLRKGQRFGLQYDFAQFIQVFSRAHSKQFIPFIGQTP